MTSPTDGPAIETGTVQFADQGRSPMNDRRIFGGTALSLGGALFFVSWIGDILATGFFADLEPHMLQLLFFGVTTVAVASGIWISTQFLSTERNRLMMTVGAVGLALGGLALTAGGLTASGMETLRQRS